MWRFVLSALLLGELAARPRAIQVRSLASRGAVVDLDVLVLAEESSTNNRASVLQMSVESEEGGQVGTTLSPEQRQVAHLQKYEKDFVVELNMTEAHETGKLMGIALDHDVDFQPAKVATIHKTGLIEEWNKNNPDNEVHVGDEIVRVNHIQWHANTATFVQRIVGQFKAGRKGLEGADAVLRLYIQRPRVWHHNRFALQREDAHNKEYATEFVAQLFLPDELDSSLDRIMGWALGLQHGREGAQDWKPVVIKKIEDFGPVAEWNSEHPDQLILEGDEVLQFDNVIFHHNATRWMTVLRKHYRSATVDNRTHRSALVRVQRPRWIQDAFDETHPVGEIGQEEQRSIQISFPQAASPLYLMGWEIAPSNGSYSCPAATIINRIRPSANDQRSVPRLVDMYNSEHPGAIAAGDLIVGVNGASCRQHKTAQDFYIAVREELRVAAWKGLPVNLTLRRPTGLTVQGRKNMEHGVHMEPKVMEHFRMMQSTTTTEPPPMLSGPGLPAAGDTSPTGATGATDAADGDDDEGVIGATEDDGHEDNP